MGQPVGELEEFLLLSLLRLEAAFDQIHDHSVGTHTLALCEGLDAPCDPGRKADTLANGRLLGSHSQSLHHSAPICTTTKCGPGVGGRSRLSPRGDGGA